MRAPPVFLFLSAVGVAEAFYHAWQENAFTTNWANVDFSSYASLLGVPYWVFGLVWFPLILLVGLVTTGYGRSTLGGKLLALLTVGNLFTGYLWFLDLVVINSVNPTYMGLYLTNYMLTGVVVAENWQRREMRDFTVWTVIGLAGGAFFGAFGAAALGIAGGIVGGGAGYLSRRQA